MTKSRIYKIIIVVLLTLLGICAQANAQDTFGVENYPVTNVEVKENGVYATLLDQGNELPPEPDTFRVWVQHVNDENLGPDWQRAREADKVLWCYPDKYRTPKHIFPHAEGKVYAAWRLKDGKGIVWFMTEHGINRIEKFQPQESEVTPTN